MAPMHPKKPMAMDKEPTAIRIYEATLTVSDDSSGGKGKQYIYIYMCIKEGKTRVSLLRFYQFNWGK